LCLTVSAQSSLYLSLHTKISEKDLSEFKEKLKINYPEIPTGVHITPAQIKGICDVLFIERQKSRDFELIIDRLSYSEEI
jgi:hypothetical protein